METKGIAMEEKSRRELQAEEQFKRARAKLAEVRREERKRIRKEQNHHKFMIGGCVVKYFPECFEFSELEMNRIIACAFGLKDVRNMIATVVSERDGSGADDEEGGEDFDDKEDEEIDDDFEGAE
jgi:hypothetical protein